jgi:antitoxin (DNA-binding transcriptional repressor) of toxin-antitoxin stability system
MKTIDQQDFATSASQLLDWVRIGETVEIQHQGTVVAVLSPPVVTAIPARPDFAKRLRKIYGERILHETGAEIVSAARGEQ